MRVAAYQAPLSVADADIARDLICRQLETCEKEGVEILCTPEAYLGGLADDAHSAPDFAVRVSEGTCPEYLKPMAESRVTVIVGFTEVGLQGEIYNSAAVLGKGELLGVYRKVFPAMHRSAYAAGVQLPVFDHNGTQFGIVICNDANYFEPAHLLARAGAAILFVPLNNGLPVETANQWRVRVRSTLIARAVENNLSIVSADVAGRRRGLVSYGGTAIVGQQGQVVASARPLTEELVIADVPADRPSWTPGWDGAKNSGIREAFVAALQADSPWQ